jgi:hypothetical protein
MVGVTSSNLVGRTIIFPLESFLILEQAHLIYTGPMRLSFLFILLSFFIVSCASKDQETHPTGLNIVEINANKWTALTKQNILHLAQVYDLSPFLFTKKIRIESHVQPQSHPVLTINTKYAEFPKKILAMWLHEELHWWQYSRKESIALALRELKAIYPKVPTVKGVSATDTYLHIIICYLELKAVQFYLGDKEGRDVITERMKKEKRDAWIYYQVLYKDYAIKKVIQKHKLLPEVLH